MMEPRHALDVVKAVVPPLATGVVIVAVWAWATRPGGLDAFVLPSPMAVLRALYQGWIGGTLLPHALATGKAALGGLVIGALAGLASGALIVLIRPLEYLMMPLVTALQSVPKIALAPLIISYFGFGLESKVFTVALLCFFPLFVAAATGMRAVDPRLLDMYRAFSASPLHILLHARLPAAAPYVFGALQIAVVLALIGCVVSEFVASTEGLGFIIKSGSGELDIAGMFAAILSLSAMGVAAGLLVKEAQRRIVFWS
ncbi:ABC transporter permease [Chelatococcus reniformis]|nr:ABC transporter permease [Chelatococcus reniformis]